MRELGKANTADEELPGETGQRELWVESGAVEVGHSGHHLFGEGDNAGHLGLRNVEARHVGPRDTNDAARQSSLSARQRTGRQLCAPPHCPNSLSLSPSLSLSLSLSLAWQRA